MLKKALIISTLFLSVLLHGQDRFFNFVDGWLNNYSQELDDGYLLWGLGTGGPHPFAHDFTQNHLDFTGQAIDTFSVEFEDYVSNTTRGTSQMVVQKNENVSVMVGSVGLAFDPIEFEGALIEFDHISQTYSIISTFQENAFTQLYSLVQANDSTYLITAHYTDGDTRHSVLYNTDLSGDIRWQNDYYCAFWCDTYPQYILALSNGNTAVLLREFVDDQPFLMKRERALLVLLDPDGNELWRDYPGDEEGYRIWPGALLDQDGEILVSFTDPYYFDENDMYQFSNSNTVHLEWYDIDGTLLDQTNYLNEIINGLDTPGRVQYRMTQMQELEDGNILVTGTTGVGAVLMKVEPDGDLIWFREHLRHPLPDFGGYPDHTHVYHTTPTSDGGFLCAGQYQSDPTDIYPQGIQTAIALKVDEYGCLEPGCQTVGLEELAPSTSSGISLLKVWPNPSTGQLNVELPSGIHSSVIEGVEMRDELGRSVNGLTLRHTSTSLSTGTSTSLSTGAQGPSFELNLESLPSGAYFLQVITADGVYSARVVRE